MKLRGNHTETLWDNLQGFIHAVDWKVWVTPSWVGSPPQPHRGARRSQEAVQQATTQQQLHHMLPLCPQEPWIRGILAGHVVIFLLVLLLRRNVTFLTGVFMVLGG